MMLKPVEVSTPSQSEIGRTYMKAAEMMPHRIMMRAIQIFAPTRFNIKLLGTSNKK